MIQNYLLSFAELLLKLQKLLRQVDSALSVLIGLVQQVYALTDKNPEGKG